MSRRGAYTSADPATSPSAAFAVDAFLVGGLVAITESPLLPLTELVVSVSLLAWCCAAAYGGGLPRLRGISAYPALAAAATLGLVGAGHDPWIGALILAALGAVSARALWSRASRPALPPR
jgi:hypothetical protein